MSLVEKRKWKRAPISPLTQMMRMEVVRQANVHPTCRLDKGSRTVHQLEDVWAKRADLGRDNSKFNPKGKGLFKQRVLAVNNARVTKEDLDALRRVKEVVASLMRSKERATDIGTAERRILQPRLARKIDQMTAEQKAEFYGRVEEEIEGIVYTAKHQYVRRQRELDEAGVFHPEANAHRVHTQFWADLQRRVNITDIENTVLTTMSTGQDKSKGGGINRRESPGRTAAAAAAAAGSGNDVSRPGHRKAADGHDTRAASAREYAQEAGVEGARHTAPAGLMGRFRASMPDRFVGVPGFEEVGHVPTFEQFRQSWPRPASASSPCDVRLSPGISKGKRRQTQVMLPGFGPAVQDMNAPPVFANSRRRQTLVQLQGTGNAVEDLASEDEVFQHFKKLYEKADPRRRGRHLLAPGTPATPLLKPDLKVIETVGQHTAREKEMRAQCRIGEGILSAPSAGGRTPLHRGEPKSPGSIDDCEGDFEQGLVNVFRENRQDIPPPARGAGHRAVSVGISASGNGQQKDRTGFGDEPETGGHRGTRSGDHKGNNDNRQNKGGSGESSSTSAALQASLEASWRALYLPFRAKLDFLCKYSNPERAVDLSRAVGLLGVAGKAIPIRQKVVDLIHRVKHNGELMSAPRVFSTAELGTLHDLQCWIDLPHATSSSRSDPEWDTNAEANEVDSRDGSDEGRTGYNGVVVREAYHVLEGETGPRASGSDGLHVAGTERSEDGQTDQQAKNMERILHEEGWTRRRHSDGALLAWLRSIELRLTDKCAELCDVAWFELGETITFRGRPVVLDIPPEAMNEAMQRRVERDRMND